VAVALPPEAELLVDVLQTSPKPFAELVVVVVVVPPVLVVLVDVLPEKLKFILVEVTVVVDVVVVVVVVAPLLDFDAVVVVVVELIFNKFSLGAMIFNVLVPVVTPPKDVNDGMNEILNNSTAGINNCSLFPEIFCSSDKSLLLMLVGADSLEDLYLDIFRIVFIISSSCSLLLFILFWTLYTAELTRFNGV
jgi:hypothetical protein